MTNGMKRLVWFFISIIILLAVLCGTAFSACAETPVGRDQLIEWAAGAYRWAGEDQVAKEAGTTPADWVLIAAMRLDMLKNTESIKSSLIAAVEKEYQTGGYRKITDCQRVALALAAVGGPLTDVSGGGEINLAADSAYQNEKLASGINAQVFGLLLLDATGLTPPSTARYQKDAIIQMILKQQLSPSGGFALSGNNPDPDVTAMVITALAPYYQKNRQVAIAIEQALLFLSKAQQPDGGFKSYGVFSCESTAQVIIALCSLGIDPAKDSRFIKEGNAPLTAMLQFQQSDGGFSHKLGGKSDGQATAQAMCAFAAYVRLLEQKSPLYAFSSNQAAVYRPVVIDDSGSSSSVAAGTLESNKQISSASSSTVQGQGAVSQPSLSSKTTGQTGSESDPVSLQDTSGDVSEIAVELPSQADENPPETVNQGSPVSIRIILIYLSLFFAFGIGTAIFFLVKRKGFRLTGKLCSVLLIMMALLLVLAIGLATVRIESVEQHYGLETASFSESGDMVRFGISCAVLLEHPEAVPEQLKEYIPENGWILEETEMRLEEGDTVFDLLCRAAKTHRIPMEYSGSDHAYMEGIGYLYEFSCGALSGWMYTVNGSSAEVSCSDYRPQNGDTVYWVYTLQLGQDVS